MLRTLPEIQCKKRKAVAVARIDLVIEFLIDRKGHRVCITAVIQMEGHRDDLVGPVLLDVLDRRRKYRTVSTSD